MPRKQRSVFVEPDQHANQIIATELLTEEDHLHRDHSALDGSEHTVWEFSPMNMHKLVQLLMMENVHCILYVLEDKKLAKLSESVRERLIPHPRKIEDFEPAFLRRTEFRVPKPTSV